MRRILPFVGFIALALCAVSSSVEAAGAQTVGLFSNEPGSSNGYTLFAPLLDGTNYLIDDEGRLVHSWDTGGPGGAPYLLENGSVIRTTSIPNPVFLAGGGNGRVDQVAWDGTLAWEFEYSSDDYRAHHDLEVLPSGNVLMIAWERKTSAEAIAAGRIPALLRDGELWPEHIIEVEPTGASGGDIVWEWHVWDHLIQDYDPTKDNYGVVADQPELIDINFFDLSRTPDGEADWHHANAIDYNEELDQIMLSVRHFSEIWVIDHSTTTAEAAVHGGGNSGKGGDLLYRWGNPLAYGPGDAGDQKFFLQHDAQWIEPGLPGEGNILVFNNGNSRPGGSYSSVDEIVPPVDTFGNYSLTPGQAYGPQEQVWIYAADNPSDFFSPFISGAVRLPNGNTLICDGVHGTFVEVTPEGTIVWRYVSPVTEEGPVTQGASILAGDNVVFRAYRYAPDFPGLQGRDLTPGGPIELVDTDKDGLSDEAEVKIHGTDPLLGDTDEDGCGDGQELGDNEAAGGLRDPTNYWDFYDTPFGDVTTKDKAVNISDVGRVVARFGSRDFNSGDGSVPDKSPNRNDDPVATALGSPPAYHPALDRGVTLGPNPWNLSQADGVINISDVARVVAQFGTICA